MTYIANQDIGDYKKGDSVPDSIAKQWVEMYKFPPVDKKKTQKSNSNKKDSEKVEKVTSIPSEKKVINVNNFTK